MKNLDKILEAIDLTAHDEDENRDVASIIAEGLSRTAATGREAWEAAFKAIASRCSKDELDEIKSFFGDWLKEE